MKGGTVIWEKSTTPVVTPDYLYIENTYNGNNIITFTTTASSTLPSSNNYSNQVEYSTDKVNWSTLTFNPSTPQTITINTGDKLYLRNNSGVFNYYESLTNKYTTKITASQSHTIGGNINTLLNYNDPNNVILPYGCFSQLFQDDSSLTNITSLVLPSTTLAVYCYYNMFRNCTSITTAPSLPATTLADRCYSNMFNGCTSLVSAPSLPATTLAYYCYYNMFNGCTALTTAPTTLPATTLAMYCYNGMFQGCTALTTIPSTLPATTLAQHCYNSMFNGCTSLTTAPTLPATSLVNSCYNSMFEGCTSLTTAPSLPATTLGQECYLSMFKNCTSLTTAPSLPATNLANAGSCYNSMFFGCTSLTTAPTLPATTLGSGCYSDMFNGCTSLTTAPSLQATNLATSCYNQMFEGCTSLTTAPDLPATTLVGSCYFRMFSGCTSLNSVTTYANDISATNCITNWLNRVANIGTFYNNGTATYTVDSESGIPQGWTEVKPSTGPDYFYVENTYNAKINILYKFQGTPSSDTIQQIEYSLDKENWNIKTMPTDNYSHTLISDLNVGEKVYFRNSSGKCNTENNYLSIYCNNSHKIGGEIYTLLDYTNPNVSLPQYAFKGLFWGNNNYNKLSDASDLKLSFDTLSTGCYSQMFYSCDKLTNPPQLPATTLAPSCYTNMFNYCETMTTAPTLPATTLAQESYSFMFRNCTSLNSVTTYANDISASGCINFWLQNVAATGTLHNLGSATYPTGVLGIPSGWTEVHS